MHLCGRPSITSPGVRSLLCRGFVLFLLFGSCFSSCVLMTLKAHCWSCVPPAGSSWETPAPRHQGAGTPASCSWPLRFLTRSFSPAAQFPESLCPGPLLGLLASATLQRTRSVCLLARGLSFLPEMFHYCVLTRGSPGPHLIVLPPEHVWPTEITKSQGVQFLFKQKYTHNSQMNS